MTHTDLCRRTQDFALAVARLVHTADLVGAPRHAVEQVTRASASVAANYRSAGLARSRREFISRLGVVIEEVDECSFWLEYVAALGSPATTRPALKALLDESRQLTRIFKASRKTAARHAPPGHHRHT